MTKLTKSQKRKRKKRRAEELKIKPYERIKMKMYEMPNPFKEIPRKERRKIIQEIGKRAQEEYERLYPTIKNWVTQYDPVYLLSYCAVYFLTSPEGIDKEAIDGKLDFYHHYLEILQAFSLIEKRSFNLKPLLNNATKLQGDMQRIGEAMQLRSFNFLINLTDEEIMKRYVLSSIQGQTTSVRNWAYSEQTVKITKQLFNKMSSNFFSIYNIDHLALIDTFGRMLDTQERRLNDHLIKIKTFYREKDYKKVYRKYHEVFPNIKYNDGDEDKIYELVNSDINQMRGFLVAHADLRLSDIFTFNIKKIAELYGDVNKTKELKLIFDKWSHNFGDLNNSNIDYFIFDNPVLKKPFIKISEEEYYCPILGIYTHYLLNLLESLIINDPELLEKYNDQIKPKYLEEKVVQLFRVHFPNAKIYPNVNWKDKSGKEFETDLLVMIDSFALVIESKAGRINPPTRRGAELSVIKKLEELVVLAIRQANNFINYISVEKGIYKVISKGQEILIDTSEINYFIPLNITFENFGTVSSNLKEAIKGGLIVNPPNPMAPSISLADLEIIFELLNNEIEYLHYFIRRAEFEKHKDYVGDELDLLSFYLGSGFNIGEFEFNKESINMLLKSKELDPYFTGRDRGVAVDKPKLEMTKWWRDIINKLIERKPRYWVEMGYVLLNASEDDQKRFEKMFNNLKRRIKGGAVKYPINWVGLVTSEKYRPFNIIGFPYITKDREEKNNQIAHILTEEKKRLKKYLGGICIATAYKHSEYPYGTIAYLPGNIFD